MKYYDEVDMGPAIICEQPCDYMGENCPNANPKIHFDTPEIPDEEIMKRRILLDFLNWIHFEKGVYLARFKREEGFTFDGMPWIVYADEYLGLDKYFKDKPQNERCFLENFIRKKIRCSEFEVKDE